MQPIGETELVRGIADHCVSDQDGKTVVAAGIVGFADLTLGVRVATVLEAHIAAGRGRFRGIRHSSCWDESPDIRSKAKTPGLLMNPKFREGFAYLQRYDLSYDAWLYHTQLMELVDLARAFPETLIILNHVGAPLGMGPYAGKRAEVFQEWKHRIATLAMCPNVVVKLGGLGPPRFGFGWHKQSTPPSSAEVAEAMEPYFLWCIERFGTSRCMFESNFPTDKVSYSYTVVWNAFKRFSKDFSSQERAALFHDTAVRVYRLGNKCEA
jgi:predicted TIM-barrel fold metal-dependent hydrolase